MDSAEFLLSKIDSGITRAADTGIYSLLTGALLGEAAIVLGVGTYLDFGSLYIGGATSFILLSMVYVFNTIRVMNNRRGKSLVRLQLETFKNSEHVDKEKAIRLAEIINEVENSPMRAGQNFYDGLVEKYKTTLEPRSPPTKT